jgi:hypothetical protein
LSTTGPVTPEPAWPARPHQHTAQQQRTQPAEQVRAAGHGVGALVQEAHCEYRDAESEEPAANDDPSLEDEAGFVTAFLQRDSYP